MLIIISYLSLLILLILINLIKLPKKFILFLKKKHEVGSYAHHV